jgi:hypothetical protein
MEIIRRQLDGLLQQLTNQPNEMDLSGHKTQFHIINMYINKHINLINFIVELM